MKITPYPALSVSSFLGGHAEFPNLLETSKNKLDFINARTAIYQVLLLEQISEGDQVLVPAFACGSMVMPIKAVGASVVFIKIHEDLSLDLEDLKEKISPKSKVLILPYYFGFPQKNGQEILQLCRTYNIVLVEDCAHAIFGDFLGHIGDYSVASCMKIFPVMDGGLLISEKDLSVIHRKRFSWKKETLQLARTVNLAISNAVDSRKVPLNSNSSSESIDKLSTVETLSNIRFDDAYVGIDLKNVNMRMTRASHWLAENISTQRIVTKRRENFLELVKAFSGKRTCRALFSELPVNAVPYVFPLIVDNPDASYLQLRRKGIMVQRWEHAFHGLRGGYCPTSDYYANHLYQVPCHQELSESQLSYMISTFSQFID